MDAQDKENMISYVDDFGNTDKKKKGILPVECSKCENFGLIRTLMVFVLEVTKILCFLVKP